MDVTISGQFKRDASPPNKYLRAPRDPSSQRVSRAGGDSLRTDLCIYITANGRSMVLQYQWRMMKGHLIHMATSKGRPLATQT